MTRRSKASGKLPKARRRKGVAKRGKEPVHRRLSAVDQKSKLAQLARERDEALEQQAATADVLKLISGATFDLQSVFDKVTEFAARLCDADMAGITREHEGAYYYASVYNYPPQLHEFIKNVRHERSRGSVTGRALLDGKTIHVPDVRRDAEYTMRDFAQKAGFRTILGVPLLRDGIAIGVIVLTRSQVRPFTEKQIELVRAFATQSVIAIENARLLNELRQSLEQQTATADVLGVISSSPGALEPVFNTLLEKATRLCEAKFGNLFLRDENGFHYVAMHGAPPAYMALGKPLITLSEHPYVPLAEAVRTKQTVHVSDLSAHDSYLKQDPRIVALVDVVGARTNLTVPLLKDDDVIGAIFIYRQEVRSFTDKQIELVKNFAAQAVIAIENARLLNELRQRTTDLTESLEQQTATADVLRVISSSPTDIEPVLEAIVRTAGKLCDSEYAILYRLRDGKYHPACWNNAVAEWVNYLIDHPLSVDRNSLVGRTALERRTVHILDCLADPEYTMREAARIGNQRTMLGVPLLRDGVPIGVIGLLRTSVKPFTEKQIELVTTFADQAVIAIENTRLLNELRESLQQQTATADVLKTISRSTFDLRLVLDTLTESAALLCEADMASIVRPEGHHFVMSSNYRFPQAFIDLVRTMPVSAGRGSLAGRVLAQGNAVHIPDVLADPDYQFGLGQKAAAFRSMLGIPLLRDGTVIGIIILTRLQARPYTEKQIELVTTFADQAVIAIENVRLFEAEQERSRELSESLEQQTATSEVLKVISSSPGDLEPVFEAMLQNSVRICEAGFGQMFLREGENVRLVAAIGVPTALVEFDKRRGAFAPTSGGGLDQVMRTKQVAHIADLASKHPSYPPAKLGGARSYIAVPMLREGQLVGAIAIYRQEVRPFTDKQIELVQNFAAQAVIAIENARLLNELRESLQQQTATAEVLQVINSSAGSLAPVFEAMLDRAMHLCEAAFGGIWTLEGDRYTAVALQGIPDRYAAFLAKTTLVPGPGTAPYRLMHGESFVHNIDLASEEPYRRGDPQRRALVDLGGARTALQAALRKDDAVLGIITIYRQEVRPYTEKQIELLQNFAAQAVVAMENARLLNELRQSLQQQTATADVLKTISRSTFDLQTVFNTLIESAARLCEADHAWLFRREGELFYFAASFGHSVEEHMRIRDYLKTREVRAERGSITGRCVVEGKVVQVTDVLGDPEYTWHGAQAIGGYRAGLGAPLLREGNVIGVIFLMKKLPQPFTEKQIELVTTFADQAVIAIENVRLFDELQARTEDLSESLQQQTATADVLKVISRSTFDLQTVLDTLVQSAARLCDADSASIHRPQGNSYPYVASYGLSREYDEYMQRHPLVPGRGTVLGRTVTERKPIQVMDVAADPEYTLKEGQRLAGFRTVVGIPLLREGVPIGIIMLTRNTVRPFTDKQIDLATTFADQASIAIENVRLFDEIQDKSRQLEIASQHKSQFLANMSHELRTPLNAILGYTELMADGAYGEPSEKMRSVLKRLEANGRHLLGLINDVLDLSKIEAGQLVLELSDYSVQDIAQTARSTLEPLAADKKLAFKVEVAAELPSGHGDGRRLAQVLINLVGNAIKFTDVGEVAIKAEANNGSFHVSVRDTGPGISAADQSKLFQEFQQADNAITKKKGGTGLGLAISKRIIEMHGGRIWIDSKLGEGSTFSFTVPVRVEP